MSGSRKSSPRWARASVACPRCVRLRRRARPRPTARMRVCTRLRAVALSCVIRPWPCSLSRCPKVASSMRPCRCSPRLASLQPRTPKPRASSSSTATVPTFDSSSFARRTCRPTFSGAPPTWASPARTCFWSTAGGGGVNRAVSGVAAARQAARGAPHRQSGGAEAQAGQRPAGARRPRPKRTERARQRGRSQHRQSSQQRLTAVTEMRRLDSSAADFAAALARLTAVNTAQDEAIDTSVANIIVDVRARGDAAVLEYTYLFDRIKAPSVAALELGPAAFEAAFDALGAEQHNALVIAAERVRTYHRHQRVKSWSFTEADGTRLGQQVTPLDRVGIYVPGGKAAYPSSVLMNALPAQVAGVREIVMVVPIPNGVPSPLVLAAAHIAGVTRAFTIGGAQAIAALAYRTATIPAVDKIVGPGNAYVAAAKRRGVGVVGIDMVAGPSEIIVIADGSANPDWIAMDLFSQAEHDEA